MSKNILRSHQMPLLVFFFCLCLTAAFAGYKAKPWSPRAADSYPARLLSEKVTIAVDPLWTDALAGQTFDKEDMVTRGIMPIAIIIFNDNDFPILVEGESIELIHSQDRIKSLFPDQVVQKVFSKKGSKTKWLPNPVPKMPSPTPAGAAADPQAFDDLEHKYFGRKVVAAHEKAGGFLFVHLPEPGDIRGYLSNSRIYIPDISRHDTGQSLIYFEIELAAVMAAPANK